MNRSKFFLPVFLLAASYYGSSILAQGGEEVQPVEGVSPEEVSEIPEEVATPSSLEALTSGLSVAGARSRIEGLFSPEAVYEDPFGRYEGREQIVEHFEKMFEGIEQFDLTIKEELVSGEDAISIWTLSLKHKSLSGDGPIELNGVSHIRTVAGKVVSQVDYYDRGKILEKLPYIGFIVRFGTSRMGF